MSRESMHSLAPVPVKFSKEEPALGQEAGLWTSPDTGLMQPEAQVCEASPGIYNCCLNSSSGAWEVLSCSTVYKGSVDRLCLH